MSDDTLRLLAQTAGIATQWTDQNGAERHVSPDTLRAVLMALGLPADTDASLRNSLSVVETGANPFSTPNFTTARVGQPVVLPTHLHAVRNVEIHLENGARRTVTAIDGPEGTLTLPPFEEPGYHKVIGSTGAFTVATAPERCLTFSDIAQGSPLWGLSAQLYSLRSPDDGGIGNFMGAANLGRASARLGADVLAISPVHALFGSAPEHFSPYSPSSRLFYNPLHCEPHFAFPPDLISEVIRRCDFSVGPEQLQNSALVDWCKASPEKLRLLRELYNLMRERTGEASQWRMDFESYLASASSLLKCHATFEVLHAVNLRKNPGNWHWKNWDPEFRDPDSPQVAEFAAKHADEIQFQIFLQWLTGKSYAEAQRVCRESGMRVGLIADMAIGMDGSGSHAWSRQHEVLSGLSIGAPPDYYAADGQDWGLTTFSPRGLAASGFAPFVETLRASLQYVGGIRIDHVMGLSRLWVVPHGARPTDGAYLHFPSETMFRLVALESWRHKAVVIGEDLGTLPDGFREYLRVQGISGMRVLRFENKDNHIAAPSEWDAHSAAMTTTHDLVSTAGWWAGADLDSGQDAAAQDVRSWDRGLFWGACKDNGIVDSDRPENWDATPVVDAAIRFVAKTPCELKLISMEDALALELQFNVPGTTSERPNWQHRLDKDASTLLDDESVRRRLAPLAAPRHSE